MMHHSASPDLSPLEKTVGMLVFHFGPESSVTKQVAELLTAERLSDIEVRLSPEAERLRFEFDEYGEDEQTTAEEFLMTIKRALFDEYIVAAREELRAAERTGDSMKQTELFKRIADWKRQKDALR